MVARRLRSLREAKGLSQEKLGQILGMSQQAVAKWEKGINIPDANTLLKMSALYQVSVDYLLCNKISTQEQAVYDQRIRKLPPDKKRILDTILNELERTNKENSAVGE